MPKKKINVKSHNQKGGITAGEIYIGAPARSGKKKIFEYAAYAAIIMLALAGLTFFGLDGENMFKKDKTPNEVYNVESHDQQGGITAGKVEIENVNVIKPVVGTPPPEFQGKYLSENEPVDDHYESKLLLDVNSQVPLTGMKVGVRASSVIKLRVLPNKPSGGLSGVYMESGEGYSFMSFENARGQYIVTIITEKPEFDLLSKLEVSYE